MPILIYAGSVALLVTLVLAWLLVGVLYLRVPVLVRWFVADKFLLRAHIDYILMALLLYAFALLTPTLPMPIAVCMVVGAMSNPFFFLIFAVKPDVPRAALSPIGLSATLSFIVTTIGFGGGAIYVAWSAS